MNAFRNIAAVAIAGAFALGAAPLRAQESHDHGHNAPLASKASTGQGEAASSDHVPTGSCLTIREADRTS